MESTKPAALPISVCIIAKNEEKHIEECLRRLVPYGFEIIVADTGSTDRTVELIQKYTDKIYHFDWCDDFSAAKNYAISKASHDWILSIDCDEYIESIDTVSLAAYIKESPSTAGRILIRNRFTKNGQVNYEQVRVTRFVNRRYYHFEGAIHEQLVLISRASFTDNMTIYGTVFDTVMQTSPVKYVRPVPIIVLHVGYDASEEEMQIKSKRNIALLEQELQTHGADPYIYYQLGQCYRRLHDYERALYYYDLGLAMDVDPAADYVQTMVESYGYTLLDLKRNQDALNLTGIYDEFSGRADFVFLMGLIYMNNGLLDNAIREFQKATTMEEFAVDGTNSYKANYNIGVIYECAGYAKEACAAYRKCGSYEPALQRLKALK